MRTIGILGGMSPASTALYYDTLCALTRQRVGPRHAPDLLIRSLDFAVVEALQGAGDWAGAGALLNAEARALVAGGAELLVLATNTMHKVAGPMMAGVGVPLVHIADATAAAITARGLARPGLMATRFTMEQDFYLDRLRAAGLAPLVPGAEDRAQTHRIIYDELCAGRVTEAGRRAFEAIAGRLAHAGADSLILGCTEVGLLLDDDNVPVPVFDTARLHCAAALDRALA
ncbi:aspartate racemase [Rhodothalassium salexigens]|uniref:aspartate/glutamate racemase family protein n=1 Tax=Rhodothalassium salexigens TaxID=1086 RepID=UPI001913E14D|nr:amino acid racemase [Rhodothalassium salexigens]MBK5912267.1 aspartate racemase [Rhodothalassium salexigens]